MKLFFVLPPSRLSTRSPSHTSVLSCLPLLILFLHPHTLSLQLLPAADMLSNPSQLERSQQESLLNGNGCSSRPTHPWPTRSFSQLTSSPCQPTGRPESAQYARSYGWWPVSKVKVAGSDSLNMMDHLCSCRTTLSFSHSWVKVGRLGWWQVLIHFQNFISSMLLMESHVQGILGGGLLMERKMVSFHRATPFLFVSIRSISFYLVSFRFISFHFVLSCFDSLHFVSSHFVSLHFISLHFVLSHIVLFRSTSFCFVLFCFFFYKYPLLLGAFSLFSGFSIFYSAWVCPSVRRSGSVRFFAPKTGNRGPQPVQDQPRYWGNRTEPPRTGLLRSMVPFQTGLNRFFCVKFVVPI